MSVVTAISAIGAIDPTAPSAAPLASYGPRATTSFASLLIDGVEKVEQKLHAAEAATQAFALDDGVALHQVTFALEEARLSVELMMQVRTRVLEGYQELLRMQL